MLCIVVTFGLILIFFDISLIQLIFILVLLAIVMPFLLGLATLDEVRTRLAGLKKTGILKRLDEMKFFEKRVSTPGKKLSPGTAKAPQKPEAKVTKAKTPGKTGSGIRLHLTSFVTSLGSLGAILRARTNQGKKVEDINKMLDKAVSDKVTKSQPPASTQSPAKPDTRTGLPLPGGAGGLSVGSDAETDPFLAMSNDDFDPGLLDGLEDEPASFPNPDGDGPASGSGLPLPEPDLSIPLTEDDSGSLPAMPDGGETTGDDGLDAFKGLDGGDALDEDFGDLDDLNLDDVELDDDLGGTAPAGPAPVIEVSAEPAPPPSAPPSDSGAVKTAWIASDAPKGADGADDQIGVQSDMASFASASGGGSDEDLLSSIASDVKTVKKEKDVSLLRELKDFKAPADEIENELKEMFGRMSSVQKPGEKKESPTNGMK